MVHSLPFHPLETARNQNKALVLVALRFLRPRAEPATVESMPTVAAKKKPAPRVAARAKAAPARATKFVVPAELRPLRSGSIKFSKQETELMDRADLE